MPTFSATLRLNGKTATGVEVPDEIIAELNSGKRPAVRMTVNGHTWPNTVGVMGGRSLLGISAENRAAAGVSAGDVIEVTVELDTSTRTVDGSLSFAGVGMVMVHHLGGQPAVLILCDRKG